MEILQLLVSGLATGCIYGLVALGFVLIYKTTETINFAQGDMMTLGAFVALTLINSQYLNLPLWLALPLCLLAMAMFGYFTNRLILEPTFGQPHVAIIILTIALGMIIRFAIGLLWGHEARSLQWPLAGQKLDLMGLVIGYDEIAVISVTALLTVALYLFFARTRLGLAMQAAAQNQLAAYYMGIPVRRLHSQVWLLSGMVAAVAGILLATKSTIDAHAGLIGIKAFAGAVIGGFGSLPGALIGGLIVGISEPFAARYLSAGYSQIVPYAILLLVLLVRPSGLLPQIQRKKV